MRRPFVLGLAIGAGSVALAGTAAFVAADWLDDAALEVTPDEIQLSALRAFVRDHGVDQGAEVQATVHFGGVGCGGVVEIEVDGVREIYLVPQDSGDALAAQRSDKSVDDAIAEMERADDRCF